MPLIAQTFKAQEDVRRFPDDEKRQLVQRVVDSQMFRRAAAMRAFLLYVTNYEILGEAEKLKEHTIGVEVFGRKPDYLSTIDNIVRVRAYELRGRLERYFAAEGANEPVVITLPLGGYVPKFVPRKFAGAEAPEALPVTPDEPSPNNSDNRLRWSWLSIRTAIAVMAVATSVAVVVIALRSDHRRAALQPAGAIQDFWGQFFDEPNEELLVVYSDPGFASWQDLSGKTLNLGDYLNHKYLNAGDDKIPEGTARRLASPADVAIVGHLGMLAGQFSGQLNVEFARDVNANFFQRGNAVLLGSHRSNPWVELYEPNLNFTLEQDSHLGTPRFRNRSPQPGERPVYSIPTDLNGPAGDERENTRYGVAALLKGCGNRGLTVIAEGLNAQGTQAVGDMLTDPQRLDSLLKSIGHKPGTSVAPFEALIQFTSFPNNQYDNPRVIAFRLRPPGSCVSY